MAVVKFSHWIFHWLYTIGYNNYLCVCCTNILNNFQNAWLWWSSILSGWKWVCYKCYLIARICSLISCTLTEWSNNTEFWDSLCKNDELNYVGAAFSNLPSLLHSTRNVFYL